MSFKTWDQVKLCECAFFREGYVNPSQNISKYFGNDIKWLRANDLNNCRVFDTSRKLSKEGFFSAGKSAILFKPNTLAISKSGTIGRLGILDDFMCGNRAVINIEVNTEKCDNLFIFYFLLQNQRSIENMASGSVQKNLYISVLGSIELNLPPLPIQRRIASILTSLDDKIELNRQTNQTIETIVQTLFKEWFVDFNFPGATGEMQESELGEIPKGWKVGKLGDVYKTTSGGTPSRSKLEYYENGIIPWIKSKELNNSFITDTEERITEAALKNSSAKILPKHSVLVAMYGATVGEIGITSMQATCNQAVCAFMPNENYPYTFIYQFLKNNKVDIISRAVGSAQQNISQDLLKNLNVFLPPIELLKKYHELTISLFELIENNIFEIQTLTQLRDTLLPKLMKGEIPITETEKLASAL